MPRDVIFNVVNGGGQADIANYSTVYGTFYTNAGEVNVANSVVIGAGLVAGGGNRHFHFKQYYHGSDLSSPRRRKCQPS